MSSPDQDLEDFLAGRSDLSRRTRLKNEQPPAELDRAILAQARAAVAGSNPKVVPIPKRNRTRWMVPFAVAATVVLSFAIFREAGVETGVRMEVAPAEALREEVVTADLEPPAPADAPLPVPPPAFAPPPPQPAAQVAADQSAEVERRSAAEAPSAEQAKAVADAAPAVRPPPVTTPPVALQPPEIAVTVTEAPARSGLQGLSTQRPRTVAPPPAPPPAPAARAPSAAPAISAEDWLRDIRTLRAAGRNDLADAALEDFLAAYPGYFEQNPTVTRP